MSSPSVLGPGDARWDADFDFDADSWDAPIRGRSVPVPVGMMDKPIVRSMIRRPKDEPSQRVVRLTLSATGAALRFTVNTSLDNEEIVFLVNVPAGGARSIAFACDRFLVTATHSLLPGLNQGQGGTPAVAHYRIDDRANASSVWSFSQGVTGTGGELRLVPPPFADGLTVLGAAGVGGTLRYYEADELVVPNRRATLPVLGPQQGLVPANDLGALTFDAPVGSVWFLNWRCVG